MAFIACYYKIMRKSSSHEIRKGNFNVLVLIFAKKVWVLLVWIKIVRVLINLSVLLAIIRLDKDFLQAYSLKG